MDKIPTDGMLTMRKNLGKIQSLPLLALVPPEPLSSDPWKELKSIP